MVSILLWVVIFGLALYGLILLTFQLVRLLHGHIAAHPYLSLLFIVRDQAAIMEGLVREILSIYNTSLPNFDLVIVDDASSDETPEILKLLSKHNAFTFLEGGHQEAQPLEMGLRACRGEVICYFNLTGQVNPRLVGRLARRLLKGEEIQTPLKHCAVTLVRRKNLLP